MLIALLASATLFAGVTVRTAPKGEIYNDEPVVTNVTYTAEQIAVDPTLSTNGVPADAKAAGDAIAAVNEKADGKANKNGDEDEDFAARDISAASGAIEILNVRTFTVDEAMDVPSFTAGQVSAGIVQTSDGHHNLAEKADAAVVGAVAQVATNALDAAAAAQTTADGKFDKTGGTITGAGSPYSIDISDDAISITYDDGTKYVTERFTYVGVSDGDGHVMKFPNRNGTFALAEETAPAATNAAAAVFAAGAEYALSDVTLTTMPAAVMLASGEMINVTVGAGVTNITVGLETADGKSVVATGRSMDALLRVVCGARVTLGIDGEGSVAVVDGTGWGEIPAGTNYVTVTKTAEIGGKAVLLVNVREIK